MTLAPTNGSILIGDIHRPLGRMLTLAQGIKLTSADARVANKGSFGFFGRGPGIYCGKPIYYGLGLHDDEVVSQSMTFRNSGGARDARFISNELSKLPHSHQEPIWPADSLVATPIDNQPEASPMVSMVISHKYETEINYDGRFLKTNGASIRLGSKDYWLPVMCYTGSPGIGLDPRELVLGNNPIVDGRLVERYDRLYMTTGETSWNSANLITQLQAASNSLVKGLLPNYKHRHLLPYGFSDAVIATIAPSEETLFESTMINNKTDGPEAAVLLYPKRTVTAARYKDKLLTTTKATVRFGRLDAETYPVALLNADALNLTSENARDYLNPGGLVTNAGGNVYLVSGVSCNLLIDKVELESLGVSAPLNNYSRATVNKVLENTWVTPHRHVLSTLPSDSILASKVDLFQSVLEQNNVS